MDFYLDGSGGFHYSCSLERTIRTHHWCAKHTSLTPPPAPALGLPTAPRSIRRGGNNSSPSVQTASSNHRFHVLHQSQPDTHKTQSSFPLQIHSIKHAINRSQSSHHSPIPRLPHDAVPGGEGICQSRPRFMFVITLKIVPRLIALKVNDCQFHRLNARLRRFND